MGVILLITVRPTDLNFGMAVKWKDIKVKFVGQVHISKVKVTSSKNVLWDVPLTSESPGPAKEETHGYHWYEYDVGCFQSECGFIFHIEMHCSLITVMLETHI